MAVALAAVSTGTALITENVFEGRFMFVNELVRLGADVRIDGHHAVVRGRERLSSAPVVATDIRAGAGLVLAGLVSDGVTEVQDVHHVDRGYPDFVEQLRGLGREGRADRAARLTYSGPGKDAASARARSASSGKTSTSARCAAGHADRRADAGVGEHRPQRQRRLAAGQRGDRVSSPSSARRRAGGAPRRAAAERPAHEQREQRPGRRRRSTGPTR